MPFNSPDCDNTDQFHNNVPERALAYYHVLQCGRMVEDRALSAPLEERYAGWQDKVPTQMLEGSMGLADIEAHVLQNDSNPQPRSGTQEQFENIVNRYV